MSKTIAAAPSKAKLKTAKVVYENGPLWWYLTRVHASDPALLVIDSKGRRILPASSLEIAEWRDKASVDKVVAYDDLRAKFAKNKQQMTLAAVVQELLAKDTFDAVEVPYDFPLWLYEKLREAGLNVKMGAHNPFFPEIEIKTKDEVACLKAAQDLTVASIALGREMMRETSIKRDKTLSLGGQPLTAERVQGEMNAYLCKAGVTEFHGGPIVACGAQGGMPHERGHGVLRANELIVVDCFPRHPNHYWGDCTRTYLKGKASVWQQNVYAAVLKAQEGAMKMTKPGVKGGDIQDWVEESFEKAGFARGEDKLGNPYGFTHSLGHHLGVDLRGPGGRVMTKGGLELKVGQVHTVEPGLYYPADVNGGVGGVRLEDVVVVTETGCKNLTKLDKKDWIL